MGLFSKKKKELEPEKKEKKQYISGAGGCIVSKSILNGESKLKWLFRQESKYGNGWIAFEKNLKFLNQKTYLVEFFQGLFRKNRNIETFVVGEADFPTGEIVLADPLAYLGGEYATYLERRIPIGSYPVELSICRSKAAGLRIAAARLVISDKEAVRYETAMPKGKKIEDLGKPGVWTFFGVDTGLACFTDFIFGVTQNSLAAFGACSL